MTESTWITVSERLPEEEELVLILCKNGARFAYIATRMLGVVKVRR